MRPAVSAVLLLAFALIGCKAKEAPKAVDEAGQPQVATSIEDYDLPVDRSAQVTAIDAATGDASGMPKDGGAVVRTATRETPEAAPAAASGGENVQTAAPPPAAPAFTISDVPGTN